VLEADAEIAEGNAVSVRWSGPDDLSAYITTNRMDDGPRDQIYFTKTQAARDAYQKRTLDEGKSAQSIDTNGDGSFNQDDMAQTEVGGPSIEGDYEVRYVLANPRLILARSPLRVTDSGYLVSGPAEVPAGSRFEVNWSGPMTAGDFVTIEEAGLKRAFTPFGGRPSLAEGKPMPLVAPAEPGDYEIRYVLANGYTTYGGMQHVVQASYPITVTAVQAEVSAPSEVVGGSSVLVSLSPVPGDGWEDDYVSLVEPGATKYSRDSWVSLSKSDDGGKTVRLQAPNIDGSYELVYFLAPGDKPLARVPVTITRAPASVDAPASVEAGTDFQVTYSGPIYRGDRIIVAPVRYQDNEMWRWSANYGFAVKAGEGEGTVRGSRAIKEPGEYIVRYVTGLQHQTLARDTLIVTAPTPPP
jgi:Ca-activated chloride channel family protein